MSDYKWCPKCGAKLIFEGHDEYQCSRSGKFWTEEEIDNYEPESESETEPESEPETEPIIKDYDPEDTPPTPYDPNFSHNACIGDNGKCEGKVIALDDKMAMCEDCGKYYFRRNLNLDLEEFDGYNGRYYRDESIFVVTWRIISHSSLIKDISDSIGMEPEATMAILTSTGGILILILLMRL